MPKGTPNPDKVVKIRNLSEEEVAEIVAGAATNGESLLGAWKEKGERGTAGEASQFMPKMAYRGTPDQVRNFLGLVMPGISACETEDLVAKVFISEDVVPDSATFGHYNVAIKLGSPEPVKKDPVATAVNFIRSGKASDEELKALQAELKALLGGK